MKNSTFSPTLTTFSSAGGDIIVAIAATTVKASGAAVMTAQNVGGTAANPDRIMSDYDPPTATFGAITNTKGTELATTITSDENGHLYWMYKAGSSTYNASSVVSGGTKLAGILVGDSRPITITGLTSGTKYTIYVVAQDSTGNYSSVATSTNTTADITAPKLVAPALISATATADSSFSTSGGLKLYFNEVVIANSPTVRVYDASTKELLDDAAVITNGSSTSDSIVEIATSVFTSSSPYAGKTVILEVDSALNTNQVIDGNSNEWSQVGLTGSNLLKVNVVDAVAPTATATNYTPVGTSRTGKRIALDTVWTVNFNKPIKIDNNSFDARIQLLTTSPSTFTDYERVSVSNASIVNDTTLRIDPLRSLLPDTVYRLSLASGSVENLSGTNTTAPFNSDGQYTVDNTTTAPTFSPKNGATEVTLSSNMTVTFSEDIYSAETVSGVVKYFLADKFDTDSLFYLRKGSTDVPFSSSISGTSTAGNSIVTVDPTSTLDRGTKYTFGFKNVYDESGNAFANQEISFTTTGNSKYTGKVTWRPDSTNTSVRTVIKPDDTVRVVFDGPLYTYQPVAADNNLPITVSYLETNNVFSFSPSVEFTILLESWTTDGTVVGLVPKTALPDSTNYTVSVLANLVQVSTGNLTVIGAASNTYMSNDDTAPKLEALIPAHNSSASLSTTLKVDFNEEVKGGSGTITIYKWNGIIAKQVDASTLSASNASGVIDIMSLSGLEVGTEYYVIIPSGAIVDKAGNAWSGITVEDGWTITVQTSTSPVASLWFPQFSGVSVSSDLFIAFDRAVALGTGSIAVYDKDSVAHDLIRVNDGTTSISIDEDEVVIDIEKLKGGTTYFVELDSAMFVDSSDKTKAHAGIGRTLWSFTTESNDAPKVVSLSPATGSTGLTTDITAQINFDRPVVVGTGWIAVHKTDGKTVVDSINVTGNEITLSNGDSTVSFDLSSVLSLNTEYYIIVPAGSFTNKSEIPEPFSGLLQTTSWKFSTGADNTAPTLSSWSPTGTILDNHPVLKMVFDEKVVLGSSGGTLKITRKDSANASVTVALTSSMIGSDSITVTVTYEATSTVGLDKNANYYVTVSSGSFKDLTGNSFAGVTGSTSWTFVTGSDFATDSPDLTESSFTIYPNPVSEKLTISNATQLSRIIVTNVAGQRVKDIIAPGSDVLDMGDVRSGIYFFTLVKDGAVVKTDRVVKQ